MKVGGGSTSYLELFAKANSVVRLGLDMGSLPLSVSRPEHRLSTNSARRAIRHLPRPARDFPPDEVYFYPATFSSRIPPCGS